MDNDLLMDYVIATTCSQASTCCTENWTTSCRSLTA